MTSVSEETVDHLARLAHLRLSAEERTLFTKHLREILAYAESLQALATDAVPPMSHAGAAEVFREDTPVTGLPRQEALAEAPDAESGLFRVPRVLGA